MECKKCSGRLKVARMCRRVRLRCCDCGSEYQIHEIAGQLDRETEALLEQYTCLIYD